MSSFVFWFRSRLMALVGVCVLGLAQMACAHPGPFEPAVLVQARIGGPVYGPVGAPGYGPPQVLISPLPMHAVPPPVVWGAPAVVVPVRPWVHPGHHGKAWKGSFHGGGRRNHPYR